MGNEMAEHEGKIKVQVGVFSGRRNPEFVMGPSAEAQFGEMMRAVIGVEPANSPGSPKLGEFYGFLVTVPAEMVRELDLPEFSEIWRGVVTLATPHANNGHWRDTAGVEAFLIEQALEAGHGEIMREYGIESRKAE